MSSPSTKREVVLETAALLGLFLSALIVMVALMVIHHDAPAIPALSYWGSFALVVAVRATLLVSYPRRSS